MYNDQAVHQRKHCDGNGISVCVGAQEAGVAPARHESGDVIERIEIAGTGMIVKDRIAQRFRPGLQGNTGHVVVGMVGPAVQLVDQQGQGLRERRARLVVEQGHEDFTDARDTDLGAGGDDLLLAAEVAVDSGGRHSCGGYHILDRGGMEAIAGEAEPT
jgi:hypothetical protein